MNRRRRHLHIAAVVGLIGGAVGILAGMIQATVGSQIPNLSGHKADPVALGCLTILLSAISVLYAAILRRDGAVPPGRRLAATAGLLIPGSLCFSTVGALWYLPGALLLTSGMLAVAIDISGDISGTRTVLAQRWPDLLVSVLGAFELLMAVSARPLTTVAVGVIGGVALVAASWPPDGRVRLALLLIGTLPFAVLTWWSVASPVIAVLALTIGLTTFRRAAVLPAEQTIPAATARM